MEVCYWGGGECGRWCCVVYIRVGIAFCCVEVNVWEVYGLGAMLDEKTCVMGVIIVIMSAKDVVFKFPCVY